MKTLEQLYEYKGGETTSLIDNRDLSRLIDFIPVEDWSKFGFTLKEGVDPKTVVTVPLTQEEVIKRLKGDLSFAFEKALNKRGISSSLMWDVIKMWMWVLDDELQDFENYAQYGLPLYKAVAVKYGLDNPIGDDNGDEYQYSSDSY
jgi:hypothetical protein